MTRRKKSARFVEIAAAAGVSTATVNRVLNESGSVSAPTRAKVVAAAKRLGVPRVLPDPRHGLTRFDVILAQSPTPYFRRLELALQRTAQMLDARIVIHRHRVDAQDEAQVLAAIGRSGQPGHRRDGLMVALRDSPAVRQALREQVERGVPVVTLMSPIAEVPQLHYAGIDNLSAGRTAGHFIGRLAGASSIGAAQGSGAAGQVLLLTHSLSYRAHAERMLGCQQVLAQRHPQLAVSAPVECLDDADRCHLAVQRALLAGRSNGRPLVAIYHSGAGTGGVASALQQAGTGGSHIAWIGHELSDEHRRWLQQGLLDLVIDQDPDGQIVAGLHHLLHACTYVDQPAPTEPNEFRLFCAENLRRPTPYLDAPLAAPLDKIVR